MTKASDNLFPKIIIQEAASDGSDFSNPTADYRVLFLGEDGNLHLRDSAGAVTTVSSPSAITQAYVGYDTAGGSWETMTSKRVYAKKLTLANNCLMTNIEAYVQNDAAAADDQVEGLSVVLYDDSAGTPNNIIAYTTNRDASMLLDDTSGAGGDGTARWIGVPIGKWLTAGDYWIGVSALETVNSIQIAYDGSGTDRYYTSANNWFSDWGYYAPTTGTNKYSIRANTIR